MENAKPEWPANLIEDIKQAYINEYHDWSDTTDGPSLIGTLNDLYRLQMSVMDDFAEQYPEVDFYYKDIIALLDEVDVSKRPAGTVISQLNSQAETIQMAKHFANEEPTLLQIVLGAMASIILYGGGIAFVIYLLISLLSKSQ